MSTSVFDHCEDILLLVIFKQREEYSKGIFKLIHRKINDNVMAKS